MEQPTENNTSCGDADPASSSAETAAATAAATGDGSQQPTDNAPAAAEPPRPSSKTTKSSAEDDSAIAIAAPVTDIDALQYDPAKMARYVHYYKTGEDIDNPPAAADDDATSAADANDEPPPKKKKTKKNKYKKKHIPPKVLETRRAIQLCCRDKNLPLALTTFHDAMGGLIKMEAQVFYQLLNLCEGSFAERDSRSRARVVRAGGPKSAPRNGDDRERGDGGNAVAAAAPRARISLAQRLHHAHEIQTLLAALDVPIIEQAYTALVRLASRAGDYERAKKYLTEAEGTQQCKVKLRLYSSLLRGYCGELDAEDGEEGEAEGNTTVDDVPRITRDNLVNALKVWKRMHDNSGGISPGNPKKKKDKDNDAVALATALAAAAADGASSPDALLFGEGVSPKINLSEVEYSALLSCATKLHDAPVAERVLSDVADQVLVPGSKTTDAILDWFRSDKGGGGAQDDDDDDASSLSSALDHVTLPHRVDPPLGNVTNPNGKGWRIYKGCAIDSSTGELTLGAPEEEACESKNSDDDDNTKNATGDVADGEEVLVKNNDAPGKSQYKLKPVELTDRAWKAMRDMNSSIVLEGQVGGHVSQYQGGGKGKKRARGDNNGNNNNKQQQQQKNGNNNQRQQGNNKSQSRIDAWKKFEQSFLENHPAYNIVIDGANVGYYEQNFLSSPKHVDYNQIDWLIRHLLEDPKNRIILFMHERHFHHKLAPHWAFDIFKSWDGNDAPYERLTVYRTPSGMNDDWYWMHAALVNGGKESMPSVLAITNDEMRDHHFQMLAEDSFLRWKERHQVYFDFGHYNKQLGRRPTLLTYPMKYSRRIQRIVESDRGEDGDAKESGNGRGEAIVIPLPKRGDEGRFADGVHVAEEGVPVVETYVVVQRVV